MLFYKAAKFDKSNQMLNGRLSTACHCISSDNMRLDIQITAC